MGTMTSRPIMGRLRSALNLGQRSLVNDVARELRGCESVLDVGCGTESLLEQLPRVPRTVGLDAHAPALEASRRRGVHDEYLQADVAEIALPAGSFDVVMMMDLIEHLDHSVGEALLDRMEKVARRKVIVFTPNGFVEQGAYDDNPLQVHRSGWTVDDFRRRGYRVRGAKGWSALREGGSKPRRPTVVTRPLSSISQPLVRRAPRFAYSLLAVRDVERDR